MGSTSRKGRHRLVIVGGGFGGLYAALKSRRSAVDVTLIDRRNHHVFQPLLYQVATGGLSPADVAYPLRGVLRRHRNVEVLQAEVVDLDLDGRRVVLAHGDVPYDTLVLAPGAIHHYFGHQEWESRAPGLKSIEDATSIRARILGAFERAELEPEPERRRELLTFVIVGGGPTGVELAGAIGELAHHTLRSDFRRIDTAEARVLLVEGADRVLPAFPAGLSHAAERSLRRLGVEVRSGTLVDAVDDGAVTLRSGEDRARVEAATVLWAAGVKASPLGAIVARQCDARLDRSGRVEVEPDCTVPGRPELFVIGDLARLDGRDGEPLPGLAPVAMQMGRHVARTVRRRLRGKSSRPFRYVDKGTLAVIGRAAAVADFGRLRLSGYPAWLLWLFVHLMYLVEFENRVLVFVQWGWSYFTRDRSARLITGPPPD